MHIFQVLNGSRIEGNLQKLYKRIKNRLIRLTSQQELMTTLESYLQALDMLNTREIGAYALATGLAPDEYHFLNLRAGAVIEGEECYRRVLNGDFSPLEKCRGFTYKDYRLDETIRSYLDLLYYKQTSGRSLYKDAAFFDDARFINLIKNAAYAHKYQKEARENVEIHDVYTEEMYRLMRHKAVECVRFPHLGFVRQGSILWNRHFGVSWIYHVLLRPYDQTIEALALFKNELSHMFMHDGSDWSIYTGNESLLHKNAGNGHIQSNA